MSTDLAIAGVTAVLRSMLHGGLVDHVQLGAQGPVSITAEAPDRIKTDGADLPDQINLFMYHVTPNAAWRNWDMPSRDAVGNRISNPPLALDLYYLVTAYSQKQLYADVLLGYAMQYLHEIAVLTSQGIQNALSTPPPEIPILTAADVLDQVEQIKIVPHAMGTEEMSRLWMAFQTSYRPSAVYQVSVVLLQNRRPAASPLPVLTIGPWNPIWKQPGGIISNPNLNAPSPTLVAATPPNSQPAVRMGEPLTVTGFRLTDTAPATLRFTHTLTGAINDLLATAAGTALTATLPAASDAWRAGFYSVKALIGTAPSVLTTNALPVVLAPTIGTMAKSGGGTATVLTVGCNPKVWRAQRVSCIIAQLELFPDAWTTDPTDTLTFSFDETVFAGEVPWIRLRVDDVDSILINYGATPPGFLASQQAPL